MNIEEINENRALAQKRINRGAILEYLKEQNEAVYDVAIAADLDLPTPLVKKELNRLVDEGAITINSAPAQDTLNSGGLVYQCLNP